MAYIAGSRIAALCADGKTRQALVTTHAEDDGRATARVKVNGKTVTGCVFRSTTQNARLGKLCFAARSFLANGNVLPGWGDNKID